MQKKESLYTLIDTDYELIEAALNGYTVNKIIYDSNNKPIDYRLLKVNSTFEELTGLKKDEIIGKSILEIFPQIQKEWFALCDDVVTNKKDICTQYYFESLDRYYHVRMKSMQDNTFLTVFDDVTYIKKMQEKIEKQKYLHEELFNNVNVALLRTSIDSGEVIWANQSCVKLFGYKTIDEFMKISIFDLYKDPNDRKHYRAKLLRNGKLKRTILKMKKVNNKVIPLAISSTVHYENGTPLWIDSTIHDITKQQRAQEHLELNSIVFEHTLEAVVISDDKHKVLTVNKAYSDITGYDKKEVKGKSFKLLWCSEGIDNPPCEDILQELTTKGVWQGEVYKKHKDGDKFPVHLTIIQEIKDGKPKHYISIFYDITYRKQSEEKLYRLAHFDTLTQLYNRYSFMDRLQANIQTCVRYSQKCAVLFMDLDGFKAINDTYGHNAGDEVLVIIAKRLKKIIRKSDMIARIGGDEFTIIVDKFDDFHALNLLAHKIIKNISEEVEVNGCILRVTASIGISICPDDAVELEEVLKYADNAMYQAKLSGKNSVRFFNEKLNSDSLKRIALYNELKSAIKENQFDLIYKPRVCYLTDDILGFEASLRWKNSSYGLIDFDELLPIAIQGNLMNGILSWMLDNACKEVKKYQDKYSKNFTLSLSIPDKCIESPKFMQYIKDALYQSGLNPSFLQLQFKQDMLMHKHLLEQLHVLQNLDIKIIIDNFGKGVSSIEDLERISIYGFKIDSSFIEKIKIKGSVSGTFQALVIIAKNFNAQVITDKVENKYRFKILDEFSKDKVHGLFLYPPCTAKEIDALLHDYS